MNLFQSFISIGLGRDISFDSELLSLAIPGVGVDPIEEYVLKAKKELYVYANDERYVLICKATTPDGKSLTLYPPDHGDSWRNTPNANGLNMSRSRTFPGVRIDELLNLKGDSSNQFLIKMDIEGLEVEIIENGCLNDSRINYLLIEFDYLSQVPIMNFTTRVRAVLRVRNALIVLKKNSYLLIHREGFNFAFIRKNYLLN